MSRRRRAQGGRDMIWMVSHFVEREAEMGMDEPTHENKQPVQERL